MVLLSYFSLPKSIAVTLGSAVELTLKKQSFNSDNLICKQSSSLKDKDKWIWMGFSATITYGQQFSLEKNKFKNRKAMSKKIS